MIGKVLRSGGSTRGLVRYLFGVGERNEHQAPRLVAGWDIAGWDDAGTVRAVDDAGLRRLSALLDAPNVAAGGGDRSVYHLILSSARAEPEHGLAADPALSDGQWADVARDVLRRAGLVDTPDGDDVRWVAVRHDEPGAEHVHVVATLAGQASGRRVHPRNDFYRIGEACRDAETRYGLRPTAPRDRTGTPAATRPERDKATRLGRAEPARELLRRQVREAVSRATSTAGFFDELRGAGLLVKERLSPATGDLTGYAVAVAGGDLNGRGQPVYFGGGRLASDLTLPKVRARYGEAPAVHPVSATASTRSTSPPGPAPRLSPAEREQVWAQARQAVDAAVHAITGHAGDPAAAADAAWAASDYLTGAARLVAGNGKAGPLEGAARDLDRAAREQWGRIPAPSTAGQGLRAASGLLLAARFVHQAEAAQLLALLAQLAVLADAVTRMREAQGRAEQAAAARRAAEQLHAAHAQRQAQAAAQIRPADLTATLDPSRYQHDPAATSRGRSR